MTNRIALFLSGSGYLDGSEITEATSLIIALSKYGIAVDFFAPNRNQSDVVNHNTNQESSESRNILIESARITRGNVLPLDEFNAELYNAVVLPGGFGAVKNFTTFLQDGHNAQLHSDIKKALENAIFHKLWIVGICAAPLVIALALRDLNIENSTISFGDQNNSVDFINALNHWKIKHAETKIDEHHIDYHNKLITSGAYMFHDASPYDIYICSDIIIKELSEQLTNY